jgi:hypothetical protein
MVKRRRGTKSSRGSRPSKSRSGIKSTRSRSTKKPSPRKKKSVVGRPARPAKKSALGRRTRPAGRVAPAKDAIRIVPSYSPQALRLLEQAPKPRFIYRGGPLIQSVQVFTIFWGTAWQGPQSGILTQINQFFDFVTSSKLIDQLAEYNVSGYTISHGRRIGTTTITSSPGSPISHAAIEQWLQQLVGDSNIPQPTADTLYFIYMPPGVQVGGSASGEGLCGYHDHISQLFYAVVAFPNGPDCLGPLQLFDALTSTSSHELCEAITDPIPGFGWYSDASGEIGDGWVGKTKTLGNYTVQLVWSNSGSGPL